MPLGEIFGRSDDPHFPGLIQLERTPYILDGRVNKNEAGLYTVHNLTRPAGRVKICLVSRIGSGRVGSGRLHTLTGRFESPLPHPPRPDPRGSIRSVNSPKK